MVILLWCGKRPQCWWQYFTTKLWKTQWFEIKLDYLWRQAGGWSPLQQNFGDCVVLLPPNNLYNFQATVWGAKRKQEPRCKIWGPRKSNTDLWGEGATTLKASNDALHRCEQYCVSCDADNTWKVFDWAKCWRLRSRFATKKQIELANEPNTYAVSCFTIR